MKKNFYRHADMPFYLNILNDELGICDKKIEFCKLIETKPENQILFIQPFDKNNETGIIPLWREHYNKIKHDKIDNYNICTLRDLIDSIGAYYMLLHYFVLNLNIPVGDEEIESKVFKLTVGWVKYPLNISLYYGQYRENKPGFIKDVYRGDKRIIPGYYDNKLKDEIQLELDKAHNEFILQDRIFEVNNEYLKNENYFFYYSYKQQGVIVQNYINNQAIQQPLWTLKMEKKFNVPKIDN